MDRQVGYPLFLLDYPDKGADERINLIHTLPILEQMTA